MGLVAAQFVSKGMLTSRYHQPLPAPLQPRSQIPQGSMKAGIMALGRMPERRVIVQTQVTLEPDDVRHPGQRGHMALVRVT